MTSVLTDGTPGTTNGYFWAPGVAWCCWNWVCRASGKLMDQPDLRSDVESRYLARAERRCERCHGLTIPCHVYHKTKTTAACNDKAAL